MQLLFRRQQSKNAFGRPIFKLWAKAQLDDDEQLLVKKYYMTDSMVIEVPQPNLFRNSAIFALVIFCISYPIIAINFWRAIGLGAMGVGVISFLIAVACGFFLYHQKRETIYMKDLMYGRDFSCRSIVALAKKEHEIGRVTAYLRQVLESAKHWGGTQTYEIPALPKDEALKVIVKS